MAGKQQNPLAVVGLIVIIVVALIFVVKSAMPKRYRPPDVDWTCEACGEQFYGPSAVSPTECKKCGEEEAVRSIYYMCEKCENTFEAYRRKMPPAPPTPEGTPEEAMPLIMMERFIKQADGEWVKEVSEEGRDIMSKLA